MIKEDPSYTQAIAYGFVTFGTIAAVLILASGNNNVLGYGRYSWGGNLCALGFLSVFFIPARNSFKAIFLLLTLLGLLAYSSRQALVILAITMALITLIKIKKPIYQLIVAIFSLFVIYFFDKIFHLFINTNIGMRIISLTNDSYNYAEGNRIDLMTQALNSFSNHLVFGIGPKEFINSITYNSGNYPHNIIVEVLTEYGIVGFIIITLPIIYLITTHLLQIVLHEKKLTYRFLMLLILVSFFIIANISGDLFSNRGLFISFAIYLGLNKTQSLST